MKTKYIALLIAALPLISISSARATAVDEENLKGFFQLEAKVGGKSYQLFAEFSDFNKLQLTLPNDDKGRECVGSYHVGDDNVVSPEGDMKPVRVVFAELVCSKAGGEKHAAGVQIVFTENRIESLDRGSWVTLTSQLTKDRTLPAKMKRVPKPQ